MCTNETRNFWIQVKCPDLVRVCKIALRGRQTNTQRIYRWQLEASTDGEIFLSLFRAPNPTYLGNEVQQFEVDTVHKYNCYRLLCLGAEPSNPGLSYMQLFIYSEQSSITVGNTQLTDRPRKAFYQVRTVMQFSIDCFFTFFISM